jgi:hypothetical protein
MDYQQFGQQITIQPGATSGMVTVNVLGDDRVEPDETFNINLASPTGATLGTAAGTGTIRNDDEAEPSPSGISGAVYADTNGNGIFDTDESGIPNVTVTLRNAANSVVRTAITDAQGRYSFTDLPIGTYSVAETHPVAFFDGSDRVGTAGGTLQNDQISNIPVTATMGSTGNNFGENGLRPEFISRRMFLASSPSFSVMLGQIVLATQPASSASTLAATSIAEGGSAETAPPQVATPDLAASHRTAALSTKSVAPMGASVATPPPAQSAANNESQNQSNTRFTAHTLTRFPAVAAAVDLLVLPPSVPLRRPLVSSHTPLMRNAVDAAIELGHDWRTSLGGYV